MENTDVNKTDKTPKITGVQILEPNPEATLEGHSSTSGKMTDTHPYSAIFQYVVS